MKFLTYTVVFISFTFGCAVCADGTCTKHLRLVMMKYIDLQLHGLLHEFLHVLVLELHLQSGRYDILRDTGSGNLLGWSRFGKE